MTVTSCPLSISSRARFQPTLPAPTTSAYTLPAPSMSAGYALEADLATNGGFEQLDRGLRRTDRLEPLLGVPLGPARIEHAHDHAVDIEAALSDLGDHEVGVLTVGRGDEGVCLLDSRLQ